MKTRDLVTQLANTFPADEPLKLEEAAFAANRSIDQFFAARPTPWVEIAAKAERIAKKVQQKLHEEGNDDLCVEQFLQDAFVPRNGWSAFQYVPILATSAAEKPSMLSCSRASRDYAGTAMPPASNSSDWGDFHPVQFRSMTSTVFVRRYRLDMEDSYLATIASGRWDEAKNMDGSYKVMNITSEHLAIVAKYIEYGDLREVTNSNLQSYWQAAHYGPISMEKALAKVSMRNFFDCLAAAKFLQKSNSTKSSDENLDEDDYIENQYRMLCSRLIPALEVEWHEKLCHSDYDRHQKLKLAAIVRYGCWNDEFLAGLDKVPEKTYERCEQEDTFLCEVDQEGVSDRIIDISNLVKVSALRLGAENVKIYHQFKRGHAYVADRKSYRLQAVKLELDIKGLLGPA